MTPNHPHQYQGSQLWDHRAATVFPPEIIQHFQGQSWGRVLDLGARNCLHSEQFIALGATWVTAVDLEFTRPWIKLAQLDCVVSDLQQWRDWRYDTVLIMGLLTHFSRNAAQALITSAAQGSASNVIIEYNLNARTPERSLIEPLILAEGFGIRQQWLSSQTWPARLRLQEPDSWVVWYTRG